MSGELPGGPEPRDTADRPREHRPDGPPRRLVRVLDASGQRPDAPWSPPDVTSLSAPPAQPVIHLHRPLPTAAFSRRDQRLPGFPSAAQAARRVGFTPVVRTVGGRMAPLHEDTLVIDVVAARADPHATTRERFRLVATAVADSLRDLGVPAGVGEVAGEYCPGEFSVHAGGRIKLGGTAQRVTRWGFLISTVLVLDRPEPLKRLVADCYAGLGLPVDPAVTGAVSEEAPGRSRAEVVDALVGRLVGVVPELVR